MRGAVWAGVAAGAASVALALAAVSLMRPPPGGPDVPGAQDAAGTWPARATGAASHALRALPVRVAWGQRFAQAGPAIRLVPPAEIIDAPPAPPRAERVAEPAPEAAPLPRRITMDRDPDARPPSGGALRDDAQPYADSAGRPLLAIVLVVGGPIPDLPPAASVPSTLALPAALPDARRRAEALHAAGHEIAIAEGWSPPGATAQDVEVALAGARRAVPRAVAVLGGAMPPAEMAAMLPPLAEAGMGLLAAPGGLGGAVARAREAGVPGVQADRRVDGGDAAAVARQLDLAALEATRRGAGVVTAPATATVLEGLRLWLDGARAGTVALAPLSAVLAGR